jgi:beta-lactamase class C
MPAINRRRFLALAGAAVVAPLVWRGRARADSKFDFGKLRPQIDEKVSTYMDANGVPGVAIGVAHREPGGRLQQEYFHYGVASKATGVPMDESSIVLTNSISKAFTGSLLAMNVQRGAMKLDDPIQAYLPEITVPKWGDIELTLRQLATHRSGLRTCRDSCST